MPFKEFFDSGDNMAVDNLNEFENKAYISKIWYALTNIEGTMRASILVQYKPKQSDDKTSKEESKV